MYHIGPHWTSKVYWWYSIDGGRADDQWPLAIAKQTQTQIHMSTSAIQLPVVCPTCPSVEP